MYFPVRLQYRRFTFSRPLLSESDFYQYKNALAASPRCNPFALTRAHTAFKEAFLEFRSEVFRIMLLFTIAVALVFAGTFVAEYFKMDTSKSGSGFFLVIPGFALELSAIVLTISLGISICSYSIFVSKRRHYERFLMRVLHESVSYPDFLRRMQ